MTRQGSSLGKISPSALRKLRPVLIGGVLRVGGRLQYSDLSFDERYPIFLPRRLTLPSSWSIITMLRLTLRNSVCSGGNERDVLDSSWPLYSTVLFKGLQEVNKARACGQVMAPLPKCRITAGARPFTCTGVDYFGPIFVKAGRSHVKRYGCLFTCMASCAVHIEVAH